MRTILFAAIGFVTWPAFAAPVEAQWFVSPSVGVAVRGRTGYFDPDDAAARRKTAFGLAVSRMWRRWGVEAEVSRVSSFLTGPGETALITRSSLYTATGNLMARLPQIGPLQPYATAGLGAVRITARDAADLFPVSEWQVMFDAGAGVQVPVNSRISLGADARYFRSRRGDGASSSIGFGETFVDFVRISARVSIAIRP